MKVLVTVVSVAGLVFGCGGTTNDGAEVSCEAGSCAGAGSGGLASGGSSGSGQGGVGYGGSNSGGTNAGGSAGSPAGGGSGGCGSGAVGGSGGGCNPDPTLGSEIQGNVVVFDPTLSAKQPFTGHANIIMQGTPCGWAVATYDGTASPAQNFLLQGVAPQAMNWMHLKQDGNSEDVMPTLLALYTLEDLTLLDEFAFVRGSEIEALYQAAGVARDPQKGTLLLQVVDVIGTTSTPNPGAVAKSAEAEAVAYRSASGWVLGGQTDATGMAALLNVHACEFPGTSIEVEVSESGTASAFPVVSEIGAVTVLRVTLGF